MSDFFEALKNLKDKMEEESGNYGEIDTTEYIESLNPERTEDSVSYKTSDKIVFKEKISENNAAEIIKLVNNVNEYDVNTLNEYKENILYKCGVLITCGENPVEMLIYSTKGLYNNDMFKNAVKDVIKSLYQDNKEEVCKAYKNILGSWTWIDCLEVVLQSIVELRISELSEDVYAILEKNLILRELSAKVLIAVGAENCYVSMINYFCNQPSETRADVEMVRNIFYTMARQNDTNTQLLFNAYIKYSINNNIRGVLISAVRLNLTYDILERCERYLKNNQTSSIVEIKIIRLLSKAADRNERALKILKDALKYPHTNKKEIKVGLIKVDDSIRVDTASDPNSSLKERISALISLGQANDISDIEPQLNKASAESEELDAVVCSIRVEKRQYKYLISLFNYVANREEDDKASVEATHQIKRLRTLRNEELISKLNILAVKILDNDEVKNVKKVLKVIEIFQSGIPNDEIGVMFNNKLNNTDHTSVKEKIIQFYKREYKKFSPNIKEEIKKSILKCTYDKTVKECAMDCLNTINSYTDFTPVKA